MRLEFRHDKRNATDWVVYVDHNGQVCGAGQAASHVMRDFLDLSNPLPGDFDHYSGSLDPDDYGRLIAYRGDHSLSVVWHVFWRDRVEFYCR